MDRLSFQKVFYHLDNLHDYVKSGDCYPVHMIVGLTNCCNHACIWCYGYDTISSRYNENYFAPANMIVDTIAEAGELGLRSITLVGTGEPTLHPDFNSIVRNVQSSGVEIGLFTNGSLINEQMAESIIETHTFMRLSCSAADTEQHNKLHHAGREVDDFEKIVKNMKMLVEKRGGKKFPTIGVQFSVSHHNWRSLLYACALWKDAGVDYFAIKPVYKHPKVSQHEENQAPLEDVLDLMREAKQLEGGTFKVYAKYEQFGKVLSIEKRSRGYNKCHGQAFTTFLDPDGTLFVCGNMHGNKDFIVGNVIKEGSFKAVWSGEERKGILKNIDVAKCPVGCRMDPLNLIIEDILHPDADIHPAFL